MSAGPSVPGATDALIAQAIARAGAVREDWRVLSELLAGAGDTEAPASLKAVRDLMGAELIPGTDLNNLPARGISPRIGTLS